MKNIMTLLFCLFLVTAGLNAQTISESKKRLVWELGSNLSLSGALHVQGADTALVARRFAAAKKAGAALGITIPDLPAVSGNKVNDVAMILRYLLTSNGAPVGNILQQKLGVEHVAIFEIALKSNVLLMMYGPGESLTNTIANVIRNRRTTANLPNAMTDPLLQLIARQATFEEVKAELLSLHEFAPAFIALLEFNDNGERLYAAEDYLGSAAEFTKAIGVDATGPEYYFGRARAYLQLGKNLEAIADYTKVIQLKGTSSTVARNLPLVYHNRGLCYGLISKNALAIADLTNAIKLRPDYASAYKVRGLVYKRMGNANLSNADLQTAERLQPGITK